MTGFVRLAGIGIVREPLQKVIRIVVLGIAVFRKSRPTIIYVGAAPVKREKIDQISSTQCREVREKIH